MATLDDLYELGYEMKTLPGRFPHYTLTGFGQDYVLTPGTDEEQNIIDSLAHPGSHRERLFAYHHPDAAEALLTLTRNGYTVERAKPPTQARIDEKLAAGECPFCGKRLRQVKRHIATQHPTDDVFRVRGGTVKLTGQLPADLVAHADTLPPLQRKDDT